MKTVTPEQFSKIYGDAGVALFKNPQTTQPKSSGYLSNVGSDIRNNINEASQSLTASGEGRMNPLYAGANIAQNVSGAVLAPVAEAPGLKQLSQGFGKVGQAIVDTKIGNKVTDFLSKKFSPETLGAASDVAETGLNVAGIEGTIQSLKGGIGSIKNATESSAESGRAAIDALGKRIGASTGEMPSNIMNRVARLKPTDFNEFKRLSGKTPGEYLTETGNFGAPDKIVATEAQKFAETLAAKDQAIAQLPGEYKMGVVKDALTDLYTKALKTSSDSVKSPYLDNVKGLIKKYNEQGLNMQEINSVKRLYEREIKLGYKGVGAQMNPTEVQRATNVDTALREWQDTKAKELGFTNLPELSKQIQLSKFLVNKLGEQLTGQSGLNAVSLTDWIVLSGGNPQAIGGFLAKKFLGSKNVQSRIAQMLNQKEIQAPIRPQIENPTGGSSKPIELPALQKSEKIASSNATTGKLKGQATSLTAGGSSVSITPESVASKVDATDLKLIRDYLNKGDINSYTKSQRMLEAMGIRGFDEVTLKRFLNEVLDLSSKKLTFTKGKGGRFTGSIRK